MSFADYSNKKKKKYNSFAEYSNDHHGTTTSKNDDDEKKEKKYNSFAEWSNEHHGTTTDDDDIAPVFGKEETKSTSQTIETTQAIFDKYGKYYNLPDYDEYSKKGASVVNPTYDEADGWANLAGYRPGAKKVGNIVTFSRDNYGMIAMSKNPVGKATYQHMTDFEVGIYNYLLAKEGEDSAQEFLDDIEETLNARLGGQIAEKIQALPTVPSVILHGTQSVGSGVESAGIGIKQLFSEEALPTTVNESINQSLLEDLDGFSKELYQAGNTVGNMIPSLMVSSINLTAGRIIQGSSAAGSSYRQALKEGKSKEEAAAYGVMIGGLEFATSKLLSGIAKTTGSLPEKALSKIAAFENTLLRVGAKYAITTASEITEEEIQLWAEPLARKIAFGEDYDAPTLEEMAETAIITALSTNILNSTTDIATGNLAKVNGLTQHEAKVIDEVYKKRLAEESEKRTLSNQDKNKLYDRVVEEMKRGYVSTDEIESILGGETYKGYKDLTEQETALQSKKKAIESEIKELAKTPETQLERLTSLIEEARGIKEQIKALDTKTAKRNLFNEVNKLTSKDTYLRESYNETARRGQAFTADLSQYKGKQREAIERAINSGVLNNTNRSHELVDFLSYVEAEKGILFDYTNNKRLKESGFALKGKTVNGFADGNKITLNVQSPKAWQAVVGHEISHVLEGTGDYYKAMQSALFERAESKGEYQSRYDSLVELYKGVKGYETDFEAKIKKELTADLVGDYLFSDKDFINKLTGNRTLFQKVWDEVKYLCKVATGKELTEIEKVEREFARAWKEQGQIAQSEESGDSDVKYHISKEFSNDIDMALEGKMGENSQVKARDYTPAILVENGVNDLPMLITQKHIKSIIYSKAEARALGLKIGKKNHYHGLGKDLLIKAVDSMDNPLEIYKQADDRYLIITEVKNSNGDNVIVPVKIDGKGTYNDVYIDENQILSVYGRKNLENYLSENNFVRVYKKGTALNPEVQFPDISSSSKVEGVKTIDTTSTDNSIAPLPENVNTQFSVSEETDTNYMSAVERGDTETAQKMVDEAAKNAGYDIKAYHGTGYDFTVFDKSKQGDNYHDWGRLGKGFYFAPTSREAETWAELSKGGKNKVMPVYLRSENMLDSFEALPDNLKDTIPENWDSLTRRLAEKYAYNYIEYMQEFGYNVQQILTEKGYDGINGHTEFVVFDPEQVKSADVVTKDNNGNVIPLSERFNTANEDIRFSLSKSVEETKDLIAVHNLREDKLLKSLNLGGLPMPSIAIVRAKEGHDNFGDISLVFGKETIDPKFMRGNKVYSADGWTPTYPQIEYKLNESAQKGIEKKIDALVPSDVQKDLGGLFLDAYNLEHTLNRSSDIVSSYKNNYAMKYAFLRDSGVDLTLPMKNASLSRTGRLSDESIIKVAETFSEEELLDIWNGDDPYKYEPVIRNIVVDGIKEKYRDKPRVAEALIPKEELSLGTLMDYAEDALKYKENGIKQEIDYKEATALINNSIDTAKYEAWLKDLFSNIVAKEGIRNNKDLFTPSGNRRSFEALHYEHTLENVVKAMKEEGTIGIGAFSRNNILGSSVVEYNSIGEIKEKANERMKSLPKEEFDNIKRGFTDRFFELVYSLPKHKDSFSAKDDAANMLCEAVMKYRTKSGMANYLRKECEGWANYSEDVVDDLIELVNDIRNMPTSYFEAKPQRAVGFDEVATAIIPDNASAELKAKLTENDIPFVEYESGNEQARLEALNSIEDARFSLSNEGEQFAPAGNYSTPLNEAALDIAPVAEGVAENATTISADAAEDTTFDVPVVSDETTSEDIIKTVKERLNAKITNSTEQLEKTKLLRDWVKESYANKIEKLQSQYDSKKNKDTKVAVRLKNRIENLRRVAADLDTDLARQISNIESRITKMGERMQEPPKKDILEVRYERIDKHLELDKTSLAEAYETRRAELEKVLADKSSYFSRKALELYNEVNSMKKGVKVSDDLRYLLDNLDMSEANKSTSYRSLRTALLNIKNSPNKTINSNSFIESISREMLNRSYENDAYELSEIDNQYQQEVEQLEAEAEKQKATVREEAQALRRGDVRTQKIAEVESILNSKGFSLDSMLDNPIRQLSTLETVDTMPQRVMEKTFGYEEGQALADATVNKVAQNETEGTKWLDSITNRKNGLLAELSKKYHIKPRSKEIEAAQIYAEGYWVDEETGKEFAYGDQELAKDFPDVSVQNNIKALVQDPRIRQFYDETLELINESRKRNGYPEIPKRANYYLHFREMGDYFTEFGLPFNPNDMKAKDLPTDMVGRTADLKPGQPYFSSSMQRKGKKTSYDLFEGMERYANSAKNQIFHIDDIQTLRALHYHLAERFGQAQGLEDLNSLTPEQASERIKQVYGSHLSTFAAFLDTEANILAGKTSMIDRALSEGVLGRRVLTFMDALNKQTGAAMIGYNVSSANTNWLPVVREFATANPVDSVKALAQTVANIAKRGKFDSFRDDSTIYIRRKGADRFNRKLWQKLQDPGYALMGAVDSIGTELIARTEYNKAIRNGMSEQEAHYESDKKVSRLMADRSLGQMPQLYTSRLMGLVTKFQLELRNDLDSMFYDTLQEAKLSRKDIENNLERNAKTAADVAWRYGATAIALHAFGQAFESVAGYNPAFDIIEAVSKAFGWDDDEDDEDTWRDNLGEGAMSLIEDLPYASIFLDGGRIPISSALPDVKGIITGEDENGYKKTFGDSLLEIAPYMLPAGGNQIKKTYQGLKMFSDEHPVSGSYTDSGNLRFPVEDTLLNKVQAGIFGQYASKNAREYFDNDYAPLKEKQIQEYIDVDLPIADYWKYREGLKGKDTLGEKAAYISELDLPIAKKNLLINNIADRDEPIDLTDMVLYDDWGEFDYAKKYPGKYEFLKANNISVEEYESFDEEAKEAYSWAYQNPDKFALSKVVADDVVQYKRYTKSLSKIKADKDAYGDSITGSRKEKVLDYINNLNADYETKIILWKSEYPSDDTYNMEIINYINNRTDLTYEERVAIFTELGFTVSDGSVYWD